MSKLTNVSNVGVGVEGVYSSPLQANSAHTDMSKQTTSNIDINFFFIAILLFLYLHSKTKGALPNRHCTSFQIIYNIL